MRGIRIVYFSWLHRAQRGDQNSVSIISFRSPYDILWFTPYCLLLFIVVARASPTQYQQPPRMEKVFRITKTHWRKSYAFDNI